MNDDKITSACLEKTWSQIYGKKYIVDNWRKEKVLTIEILIEEIKNSLKIKNITGFYDKHAGKLYIHHLHSAIEIFSISGNCIYDRGYESDIFIPLLLQKDKTLYFYGNYLFSSSHSIVDYCFKEGCLYYLLKGDEVNGAVVCIDELSAQIRWQTPHFISQTAHFTPIFDCFQFHDGKATLAVQDLFNLSFFDYKSGKLCSTQSIEGIESNKTLLQCPNCGYYFSIETGKIPVIPHFIGQCPSCKSGIKI